MAWSSSEASLYLHLPFCRAMCGYCGCNTTLTARDQPIARYITSLSSEIDLVGSIPGRVGARQIYFGGSTPTLMQPAQSAALMAQLRTRFAVAADAEIAIKIGSRTLDQPMVDALAAEGQPRRPWRGSISCNRLISGTTIMAPYPPSGLRPAYALATGRKSLRNSPGWLRWRKRV